MNISPSFDSIYKAASLSFGSQVLENNADENFKDFKVFLQTRSRENQHGEPPTQNYDPGVQLKYKENSIEVHDMRNDVTETFHCDNLVNQNTSFVKVAIPSIKNTLLGQNSGIFVYDHSRFGKNQASGFYGEKLNNDSETLVGKCLKYFFEYFEMVKKNQGEKYRWGLNISLSQIYLNNIIDLLDPNKSLLNIPERENSIQTSQIKSAKVKVENLNQAFSLLNDGLFIKSDAHQSLNRISQKSHHILTLEVYQEFQQPKSQNVAKCVSQFRIIDLVYLENLKDEALSLEDKFIKSTLRALQKQFSETSLSSSRKNSTLLKYLHSSFGENKKISLLATISPDIKETISILKFACQNSSEQKMVNSQLKVVEKLSTLQSSTQRGRREETMNTLRGINQTTNTTERDYAIEKRKFVGNVKAVDSDLVNCLVNTMVDIKKLFLDKIFDAFYIREKYIARMIGDLQRNLEDNRKSVERLDAKFYLKQNKLLQEIQRKFPNSPQELPKDENDINTDILVSANVEVVVQEMKKAAKFIIESITSFGKNSINLEKVKFELLKEKSERLKLESQIQNLTVLTQTLCKQNKKLYGETTMLNYSHVRSSDRNRLYAAYQQEQNTLIKSLLKEDDEIFKLQKKFDLSEFESELGYRAPPRVSSNETNSIGVQTDFDNDNYLSVNSAGSFPKFRGSSLPFDNLRDLEPPFSISRRKSSNQELTFRKRTISHSKNNWLEAQQQYALMNDQDAINIHFYDDRGNEMQRGFLNVKENRNEDFDEESSSLLDEKRKTSEFKKQQRRDEEEMKERNSEYDDKSVDFSIKADRPMIERDISVPSNPLDMSGPDLKFDGNIMMVDGMSQYSESPDKVFAAEESKIEVKEISKEIKADGDGEGEGENEAILSSKRDKNNLSTEHTEIRDTKRSPRKNTTETVAKSTDHFMSPILKNVLSLTETKSNNNIREMDFSHFNLESPTQSQVSANTKDLLALKRLNTLKFRDRSPATILKSKNKRGRIPTQSFSLSKLSLGNLSLSLEKVDPDKYSVDARARNSTQPEEDPNQEMDIYAQNIYNTLKANQRLPTDSYRMKSKLIKFDDKPSLPKLVKVAENLTPKKKKIPGLRSLKTTAFGHKKDKSNSSIEVDKSFDRSSTFE